MSIHGAVRIGRTKALLSAVAMSGENSATATWDLGRQRHG